MGLAWVPASVMQFCRPGVVYREVVHASGTGRKPVALPTCETSLAWPAGVLSPALERFVEFVRAQR